MQYSANRILLIPALFFSMFFSFQCKRKPKEANTARTNAPVIVDVLIAKSESVNNVVEANGTVLASEFVELRPEVSGRLTYLNLPEGRAVAKGTVIARVNDAELRAQVSKNRVQLELAQKTVDRYKQLLAVNGLNQADYDAALNQVNSLNADILYTEALIDKTVVRAPFSGVLGLRQVSPGAFVTPATIIATLQQTKEVKIDFTLPEIYGNIVKNGSTVDVEVDAISKERNKALIIATEPGANTDTRNLKVRAILKTANVNPGAFVKVYIDAGKGRNSIKVPTNCIIPDDRNNQVILVKNGIANFVNIQTGYRESNTVEIIDGVNEGDSVVVTGVLFARPKSKLQVRSSKTLAELISISDSL